MARSRLQAGGYGGGAARIHAAMGSLHACRWLTAHGGGTMTATELRAVDDTTYLEIQRFLFREAALLDGRDYGGWLALVTEDIRYRVNAMVSRDAGAKAVDYAIIDEDIVGLKSRIDQISNPRLTRAENPPSLTRRVVSNIEVGSADEGDLTVASNFILVHARWDTQQIWAGRTLHRLRRDGAAFKMAFKKVLLINAEQEIPLLQFLI